MMETTETQPDPKAGPLFTAGGFAVCSYFAAAPFAAFAL